MTPAPSGAAARALSARAVRRIILEQSRRADVGHIGSCLCVVELLCAIHGLLRARGPDDPERDRVILSKGHAALALYAVLALRGWLPASQLDTFCGDGSALGVHPDHRVPGVDFATGSLGHGLGFAVGAALAARLQRSDRRVFCIVSDAECNTGSLWESAMVAAHHRLGRLAAVIDVDGQQAFGLTREVVDPGDLARRWAAFGWRTVTVDGHSIPQLVDALAMGADDAAPLAVLAHTTFGKGVSFIERGISPSRPALAPQAINWHYLPMSEDEFRQALREVDAQP